MLVINILLWYDHKIIQKTPQKETYSLLEDFIFKLLLERGATERQKWSSGRVILKLEYQNVLGIFIKTWLPAYYLYVDWSGQIVLTEQRYSFEILKCSFDDKIELFLSETDFTNATCRWHKKM